MANNPAIDRVIEALKTAGCTHEGGNAWTCPSHSDERASFAVDPRKDGRGAVVTCSAGCSFEEILEALSLKKEDLLNGPVTTIYTYEDENGVDVLEVVRVDYPSGKKEFKQRVAGKEFVKGAVKGIKPLLYGLTEVLEAVKSGKTIFLVEGEKSVLALSSRGRVATTAAMGSEAWKPEHTEWLRGAAEVVIVADRDPAGYRHAAMVAHELKGAVGKLSVVHSKTEGFKDDIVEHIEAGYKAKDLIKLTAQELRALAGVEEVTVKIGSGTKPKPDVDSVDDGSIDDEHGENIWPPPTKPLKVAHKFVHHYRKLDGVTTMVHWRNAFYDWNGHSYDEVEEGKLDKEFYKILDKASLWKPETQTTPAHAIPWDPVKDKLKTAYHALAAVTRIESTIEDGQWRDNSEHGLVIPFANGNLEFDSRELLKPTPQFFTLSSLPYPYDTTAGKPAAWLKFLSQLWKDDAQSIALLQEWFGYVLSGDTSLQKMLFLLGPSRSGKSTITKILEALVGKNNVVAASLNSMGVRFGLLPWIGKTLAIPGDVRIAQRDQQQIVQYLVNITGEDSVTIERKGINDPWTGKLSTRFMVVSNDMPSLEDSSGAIVARTLLLRTTHGYIGMEDTGLYRKLEAELPGILLWALEGLARLRTREHFTDVDAVASDLITMRQMTSPVKAFVDEMCVLGSGAKIPCDLLFNEWRMWADSRGEYSGKLSSFGGKLKSAFPETSWKKLGARGQQQGHYVGIKLRML